MTTDLPILFYSPGACSLAGQIVLEWLGLPYALSRVEREVRGAELYRRINPRGQVPAFRTSNGRILVENAAVLQHLSSLRRDLTLTPGPGTPDADSLNQWLSYLDSGFHVAFYPLFLPERYTTDPTGIDAVQAAAAARVRAELAHVEAHLGDGRSWMMGDRRSILDPYLFAMARWAPKVVSIADEFPRVASFQDRMSADPAARFALAMERGDGDAASVGSYVRSYELAEL
jgi:glutathione S-transferase